MRRNLFAVTREWYRRSWAGRQATLTNGLLAVIFAALVSLGVALPYWAREDSEADRQREIELELVASYRDCVQDVQRGADLKAVSLSGVEHAEATAELMRSIDAILSSARTDAPLVVAMGDEIDEYAAGVAAFRRVAEAYTPTPLSTCEAMPGAALVDQ